MLMKYSLPDEVNLAYWQSVPVDQVLAGVHMPGVELDSYMYEGVQVLDYGCGAGALVPYVIEHGGEYIGIDVNKKALEKIKQDYPEVTVYETDGAAVLPVSDESVDVVLISYVLVSIVSDELLARVVDEVTRVLKPDGVVWLAEALISPDYQTHYDLGKTLLGQTNLAVSLQPDGQVKRYIRHFTESEVYQLFAPFSVQYEKVVVKTSPSSGKEVTTLVTILQK